MNPYEVLGVGKKADDEMIKAAFRTASKKAHPDTGGDAETFGRVKLAYDVLSDPERRKKYDETGKIDEKVIDQSERHALTLVFSALAAVMGSTDDPMKVDVIGNMAKHLNEDLTKIKNGTESAKKEIVALTKFVAKLKKKSAGPSPIAALVQNHINDLNEDIEKREEAVKNFKRAIEIVTDHEFDWERPPPSVAPKSPFTDYYAAGLGSHPFFRR